MSNLILGSSNESYHANRSHLSSSALKLLLKNPAEFEAKFILGQEEKSSKPNEAFLEGHMVHSLLLEPHKIIEEYAVYTGLRKQGQAWESFKQDNPGKKLLSASQMLRCEALATAYRALPVAVDMLTGGLPEHNMLGSILSVPLKARADYINIDKGYIVDVKTTSMPSEPEIFDNTVKQYMYELSAALYCELAYQSYGKLFDFYWLVLSKADKQCHVYKASSETLSQGSAMVTKALVLYKQCLKTGIWQAEQERTCFDSASYEIVEI